MPLKVLNTCCINPGILHCGRDQTSISCTKLGRRFHIVVRELIPCRCFELCKGIKLSYITRWLDGRLS